MEPSKPTQFTYRPLTEEGIIGYREWLNSVCWFRLFKDENANSMTELFYEKTTREYERFFPEKRVTIKPQSKPWVNPNIKAAMRERDMLYKTKPHCDEYKRKRNIVVRLLKQARRLYGHQIFARLSASDPRKFHTTVRKLMGQQKSKSILKDEQGKNLTAEIINAHFSNICRQQPPLNTLPQNGPIETIPVITVSQVQEKLEHLDIRKASYPGEIPIRLIHACSSFLATPLAMMYNQCLLEGVFPDKFKKAFITPIPKKTSPTSPSDLRPISKTPIISKVFEDFILQWLLAEVEHKIDPMQFGFRRGHSTTHYLVRLLHDLLEHLEISEALADIIISDFVKAFDLLDHETVINEARALEVSQFLLCIIASFLSGRQQCVQLENGEASNFQDITCGAAQGSKLGPILFVIVINRLMRQHKQRYKFADDCSISLLRFLHKHTTNSSPWLQSFGIKLIK